MNDDFILGLQHDWQAQEHDTAAILRRLRWNRWTPHIVLAVEMLGCAGALLVGLWFAWLAAHSEQHQVLFALSSGVILLTVPALAVFGVLARRAGLAWDAETPESLLRFGIRRAESSLRVIRLGRLHVAIVAAFVVTLWAAEVLSFIHVTEFLIFYTAVCFALSLVAWLWMTWREKRARGERAACARLLAALQSADHASDPDQA